MQRGGDDADNGMLNCEGTCTFVRAINMVLQPIKDFTEPE